MKKKKLKEELQEIFGAEDLQELKDFNNLKKSEEDFDYDDSQLLEQDEISLDH